MYISAAHLHLHSTQQNIGLCAKTNTTAQALTKKYLFLIHKSQTSARGTKPHSTAVSLHEHTRVTGGSSHIQYGVSTSSSMETNRRNAIPAITGLDLEQHDSEAEKRIQPLRDLNLGQHGNQPTAPAGSHPVKSRSRATYVKNWRKTSSQYSTS